MKKKYPALILMLLSGNLLAGAGDVEKLLNENRTQNLSYSRKLQNFEAAKAAAKNDSLLLRKCWIDRFAFTREELWGTVINEMLADAGLKEEDRAFVFLDLFRKRNFSGDCGRILNFFYERMSRTDGMGKVRYAVLIAMILDELYRIDSQPTNDDCRNMVRVLESARNPAVAGDPELNWYLAKAHARLGNVPPANDALQVVLKQKPEWVSDDAVYELRGDLLRAERRYQEAYEMYGKTVHSISACRKQAECAMMEQQYKHALSALERVPVDKLDEQERKILEEQIRNLKNRL